jgi:RNA polymerase primary sigma factor
MNLRIRKTPEIEIILNQEALFPNFVNDSRRNRRDLSFRAKGFITLSDTNYKFLDRFPKLDYFECKELAQIIKGEDVEGPRKFDLDIEEAKQYFISCNLKLVRNIACDHAIKFPDTDVEDLFQMGIFGLIRAVEKWDYEREFLFSTYATWWIKQSISRENSNTQELIRVPIHMMELRQKVSDYLEKYLDFFGCHPEQTEACDALEIEPYQYQNAIESMHEVIPLRTVLNKNGEIRERPEEFEYCSNSNIDPFELLFDCLLEEQFMDLLELLTPREADVIRERYALDRDYSMTLAEIGDVHGVTRERIRQIEKIALTKLRSPEVLEILRYFLEFDVSKIGHIQEIEGRFGNTSPEYLNQWV